MDPLFEVARILDSCFTTETLDRLVSPIQKTESYPDKTREGIKARLSVELFEYAGEVVMGALKRELTPSEIMLIMNRVKQFMIARGMD